MTERAIGRSILRNHDLNDHLEALLLQRGWGRRDWAKEALVGVTTIHRIFDPEDPKGVSKRLFVGAIEILTPDSSQRNKLVRLAGLPIPIRPRTGTTDPFAIRMAEIVGSYDLNPNNRDVLENELLSHAKTVGTILEQVQKSQPLSVSARRHLHLPNIS